mmetsp:Transcript_29322/g.67904  ORF Transcript_29322/g.67904 Transcript_29322/m.67904 type:complete len:181 (-) Transcript_29322:413-955(-)|eukprot:CAMPEP_0116826112 /NCGR_PEP_ID=MMETSP0418-20121206/2347_1 /TAXON_ID=1158023 /ORGANISM="Astrosyne radiata, Strain 13vi08-1A" /LENGTH=180 /DNA_ID=CAMNT_0004454709 /DNA_START=148 /DNA_END=690 /DNA_ORIENTATION=-
MSPTATNGTETNNDNNNNNNNGHRPPERAQQPSVSLPFADPHPESLASMLMLGPASHSLENSNCSDGIDAATPNSGNGLFSSGSMGETPSSLLQSTVLPLPVPVASSLRFFHEPRGIAFDGPAPTMEESRQRLAEVLEHATRICNNEMPPLRTTRELYGLGCYPTSFPPASPPGEEGDPQ